MRDVEFPEVPRPDEQARRQAVARQETLTKPVGSLGRLEELGVWIAACQGTCPPRPFARPRLVIFAADHGVAANGVSAYPPEVTAQMVTNFLTGGAAANVAAANAGVGVRVADIAVDADTPGPIAGHKVRRGSGVIGREDALTGAEVVAAVQAGRTIADEEVDGGADLLVVGDMGIANTTVAATLAAALTGIEPVAAVGRGSGVDDRGWMRKTASIRDALRRGRPVAHDPLDLLRVAGGADVAALTGFLAQAAVRRTPVVLDGLLTGVAALLAEDLAPGAAQWWIAGHRSAEPAHDAVLRQLDKEPLVDLGLRLGEGTGALAALPLLTLAGRALGEMATYEEAGVSGPVIAPPPLPGAVRD
ncbi:nicotinate-nucleotide--dimethylbenzimidazole phosphoribosyltransferase [Actinoalloteichus spitiensis]|uniref:nicotinate-nucleotide--dimethylbenzimidazole phosphoribosyltransferase n=1 Tax=Actinoalloteichus spitiensis TaxID=252394 RepID=UPI0003733CDA|nr:nicotinate-nucleotide--dimethylbenzimidazole phosphoribosyltransferase [Actinoalloteichus spitiensis]